MRSTFFHPVHVGHVCYAQHCDWSFIICLSIQKTSADIISKAGRKHRKPKILTQLKSSLSPYHVVTHIKMHKRLHYIYLETKHLLNIYKKCDMGASIHGSLEKRAHSETN
jgi:hypothetical protein